MPDSAAVVPPETGASTHSEPLISNLVAKARVFRTDVVPMSINSEPGLRLLANPSEFPSAPKTTSSTASASVNINIVTSAPSETSRGVLQTYKLSNFVASWEDFD